jgi:hypothetical protein
MTPDWFDDSWSGKFALPCEYLSRKRNEKCEFLDESDTHELLNHRKGSEQGSLISGFSERSVVSIEQPCGGECCEMRLLEVAATENEGDSSDHFMTTISRRSRMTAERN